MRRFPKHIVVMICQGCGSAITDDEAEYYGARCEGCTREDWERIRSWRAGRDDPDLDAATAGPKPVVH